MTKRNIFICLSFLTIFFHDGFTSTPSKKKYVLSMTAVFRDEARFIKEWIEFHLLVGVDHFYLLNNLSEDDYLSVLQPYIDKGVVELFDWPYESHSQESWNTIQCSGYQFIIEKSMNETKWLALLDLDEFLFPKTKKNLKKVLKIYKEYGGVCVNRRTFGSSNIQRIPEDQLLIETLTRCTAQDHPENGFVRSIVQPKRVLACKDPHIMNYKEPYFQVNEKNAPFYNSTSPYITFDILQINHYWSRDLDFFYMTKIKRRNIWDESFERCSLRDTHANEEQDHAISRFIPQLKKRYMRSTV